MSFSVSLLVKEYLIPGGLIATIIGGIYNSGVHTEAIKGNKETIKKVEIIVKEETKANQKINVEQTVAITEAVTILKQVSKNLDKLEKKLDK